MWRQSDFPVENLREKGKGVGRLGGGGQAQELASHRARVCQNDPLGYSKPPVSFSPILGFWP